MDPMHSMDFDGATVGDSLELVRRAHGGDTQALAALLARYRERLLARVRLMLGDRARAQADSEDFLHATLLVAVEDFERFELRDERGFLRWLTTIARNRIHDAVRRGRERAFQALSDSLSDEAQVQTPTPPSAVMLHEQSLRLAEALEALEAPLRDIVELRELEGLLFREIGERLGINEDQARYLHRKALLRLGERLSDRRV